MELLRVPLSLSVEDAKRHFTYAFEVPAGIGALYLRWNFEPWQVGGLKNHLTLSVEDPTGFRGAGHRHGDDHRVTLSAQSATPGYLPGPLLAGQWRVTVHSHAVLSPLHGELTVQATATPEAEAPLAKGETSLSLEPGDWMMGDLHCHTTHSDARWTATELARAAAERGLAFLSLTDHNTVSGREELKRAYAGLLLPGLELTTFYGHAVVVGHEAYIDWRGLEPQRGILALCQTLSETPAYLTLAHPFAPGDPLCNGPAYLTGHGFTCTPHLFGARRTVYAANSSWG